MERIGTDLQQAKSDLHIANTFIESVKAGTEEMDIELLHRLVTGAKKAIEMADEKRHQIECLLR
jgi:hypothetical protein